MTVRISFALLGALACVGVAACGSLGQPGAIRDALSSPPRPAEGLWAILDPGCVKPRQTDLRRWPRCASPFWISHNSAVVVRSKAAADHTVPQASYRTRYRLAPGEPLIAQVGNHKDGYLFLALTKLDRDARGRLVAATGAAFACPRSAGDSLAAAPNQGGCEVMSPANRRRAAEQTLEDPSTLNRVAWIAPGAPAAP